MKKFDSEAAEREFEEMVHLYRTDPEEFERRARAEIDCVIENADPRHRDRLRGLQFTIDAKLSRYNNPIARCNKMVELFWEGVNAFDNALHGHSFHQNKSCRGEVIAFLRKAHKE